MAIDVGFNPIFPGGESWKFDGVSFFLGLTTEVVEDIITDIAGLFSSYFVARTTSFAYVILGVAIEGVKLAGQTALLVLSSDWANRGIGLVGSGVGDILMALLAVRVDIAKAFVNWLVALCGWIGSAMQNLLSTLMGILKVEQIISRWWIDVIEIVGDIGLAIMSFARYARYV